VDVLVENRRKGRFLLHEFVIMPNHFHLQLTPAAAIPLGKALQFIKGGFSFRAKREIHFGLEIWQASFGAVCLVIGVPGDGIGRPATRAKALNLYTGAFSRV
jgi:REP element-mobilizing transposase RayT